MCDTHSQVHGMINVKGPPEVILSAHRHLHPLALRWRDSVARHMPPDFNWHCWSDPVQSHADRQAHLLRARFCWQGAIDHAALESAPGLQGALGAVHLAPGEGHQAVALAHALQRSQCHLLCLQGQQPLVLADLQGVPCASVTGRFTDSFKGAQSRLFCLRGQQPLVLKFLKGVACTGMQCDAMRAE